MVFGFPDPHWLSTTPQFHSQWAESSHDGHKDLFLNPQMAIRTKRSEGEQIFTSNRAMGSTFTFLLTK